jgi:hypothetical protein
MMQNIDLFINELEKYLEPISYHHKRINFMRVIFKTIGSFKTFPKRNPHLHTLEVVETKKIGRTHSSRGN